MITYSAARCRDAAHQRVAVAARGDADHARARGSRAIAGRVDPSAAVVGDDDLGRRCRLSRTRAAPSRCRSASVSASFRQGMTTDTFDLARAGGGA